MPSHPLRHSRAERVVQILVVSVTRRSRATRLTSRLALLDLAGAVPMLLPARVLPVRPQRGG